MWSIYLYAALLVGCCGYSFLCGGAPERIAASVMTVASLISPLVAPRGTNYQHVLMGLFLVDVIVQLVFLVLAIYADRFWPMLVVGLHSVTVMVSMAKAVVPVQPMIYYVSEQMFSFAILLILAGATERHRKRMKENGVDPPWSIS